jgi:hypothetical protein
VAEWHEREPRLADGCEVFSGAPDAEEFKRLVLAEHLINYKLWHVEDRARRKDVRPEAIAECKYVIDGLNQRRNNGMEAVDACLTALLAPLTPADAAERHNTETVGAALDRLSILSLKLFHMREQTERHDVSAEHVRGCRDKLAVLERQHGDLCRAVVELLEEYAAGTKRPRVYYQFKMYNDPALNPELYAKAGK